MLNGNKRVFCLLSAFLLLAGTAGCGSSEPSETTESVIHVGVSDRAFYGKFSPFFTESVGDQTATELTQLRLLTSDRSGEPVLNGIEGETRTYNNVDYTYYGPADLSMAEQADGSVFYDITLRDDLTFSDGEPVTADDLIFSLYVLCDPAYDGSNRLREMPIRGLQNYKLDHIALSTLIAQKGEDSTDFSQFTQEQQSTFWDAVNNGLVPFVQQLSEQLQAASDANLEEGDERLIFTPAETARAYGWEELPEDAGFKELALAMGNAFDWNFEQMDAWFSNSVMPMTDLPERLGEAYDYAGQMVSSGQNITSISGIIKTGDYSLRVVTDELDVRTLYYLGSVYIAPLHYYGSTDLYNGVDSFGFAKCDLTDIRTRNEQPLGAGPYCLTAYQNGSISYTANPAYYLGVPKIDQLVLYTGHDLEKTGSGAMDLCYSNSGVSGTWDDKNIAAVAVPSLADTAYQYIGLNPRTISVGGEPDSPASKNLRKGIATLLAAGRQSAIDTLLAEAGDTDSGGRNTSVIDYPVSALCWLVPGKEDSAYQTAYAQDVSGNSIYTTDMTDEAYWEAARNAALGFFEAAGYTIQDGRLTAAPEGASLEYEAQLWCDEHDPILRTIQNAAEQLEQLGMHLSIVNTFDDETGLPYPEPGEPDLWAATWDGTNLSGINKEGDQSEEWYLTADPACFLNPVFYCNTAQTGGDAGAQSGVFQLNDAELDQLLTAADLTLDLSQRKAIYAQSMERIMDWGCEVPCYQDHANLVYNVQKIDGTSLPTDMTGHYGWLQEIYKISLVK